jgi:hypothetical protein
MGSSPTTLEGARLADAYRRVPGNSAQGADAMQAFCQAPMLTEVGAGWPPEPAQESGWYYQLPDPTVSLLLALCGHPDNPNFWEVHCTKLVQCRGCIDIGPEWPSIFWLPALRLLLSIKRGRLQDARSKQDPHGWMKPLARSYRYGGPCSVNCSPWLPTATTHDQDAQWTDGGSDVIQHGELPRQLHRRLSGLYRKEAP